MCGTTDSKKHFHPYCVMISSNDSGNDYYFMFKAIQKQLNNLYDYTYRPNCLVADGGDQITSGFEMAFGYTCSNQYTRVMCWAHVHTNCGENSSTIADKIDRQRILDDIELMQAMPTTKMFNHALKLFLQNGTLKINLVFKYF